MTSYVALLRAVNVGGKSLAMAALRDFAAALGLADAGTVLQSGNLTFRSSGRKPAELEKLLEREAAKRLGVTTDFLVRSGRELTAIIANNPFPAAARRDPAHLLVMFLKDEPPAGAVAGLRKGIAGRESIAADARQLYIVYPDGIGRSKLTTSLIEKRIATRGTGRNWNTVVKLAAAAAAET
jgi:uncharacterized protein (DUF1697 family)